MSHWISSIIKHCCLPHSKGRLPAPISPSEILPLPSNNVFHPKVVAEKKKLKQWLVYASGAYSPRSFRGSCPPKFSVILITLKRRVCLHYHKFWRDPIIHCRADKASFSSSQSIEGVIDGILDIAETTRIYLLLSAYMWLWCWSQTFTLNLRGDTWCWEQDGVFRLSQSRDLSSSAVSRAELQHFTKPRYEGARLCSAPLTGLTDQQQRLMLPREKIEEEWQLCQG